jgi:hypothetical protein
MILTVPLAPGTALSAVRYRWIVGGLEQAEQSTGISQPDALYPLFVFSVTPPANADEMIAYDNTNPANWNVAQYKAAAAPPPPPGPPIILVTPPYGPPTLRTVAFKSVYDSILRQHGFDPVGDAVNHDTLRAIVEQINSEIHYAWRFWEWPQLELLQERAFRTIWTSTLQFYRLNAEQVQDECYYQQDGNYYRVLYTAPTDPPVGTLPTDTTYFEPIQLTNPYILLDQVNQTPIGEVIEIFASDPRLNTWHDANRVPFQPTEREITCLGSVPNTVFVQFRIVPSEFTGIPFVSGKNYALGAAIYHPATGECYRALQANPTGDPTAQPNQWLKVPFPAIFTNYVISAAFAAGLNESDPSEKDGNVLANRRALAGQALNDAQEALVQEVNRLQAQGQHYRYKRWRVPYDSSCWTLPTVSPNAV